MAFSQTLRTDTPDGSTDSPAVIDDQLREKTAGMIERLAVDHNMTASASSVYDADDCGIHLQVTFGEDNTPGAVAAGYCVLHAMADPDSAKMELAFTDEDEDTLQMTKDGKWNLTASNVPADALDERNVHIRNAQYFTAADIAGTGTVSLIGASVNENADEVATIPDGAQLESDAAPVYDPDIANKKYADDTCAFGTIVTTDTLGSVLDVAESYIPESDGFLYVDYEGSNTEYLEISLDSFNLGRWGISYSHTDVSAIPVAAGETIIFNENAGTTVLRWRPIGGTGGLVRQ